MLARNQKKAVEEGWTVVFADQSGFYLLPGKVRTYAPVGQTPIIRAPLSRGHLSAMGGITPEGKLYLLVQERAYRGIDVVGVPEALGAARLWKVVGALGRGSHPSEPGGEGVPE